MWKNRIPKMRSARLAMNLRQLAWEIIRDDPNLSYHDTQYYMGYIEDQTRFIKKRSITPKEAEQIRIDWQWEPIEVIIKKYKISRTYIFKILNNQI